MISVDQFYKCKSASDLHPDGYLNICKKCATLNYKAGNPDTFMNILYQLDVPWCPTDYKSLVAKKGKASAPNNPAILGAYIAAMKLNQNRRYGFFDSAEAQSIKGGPDTFDSIDQYDYQRPLAKASMDVPPAQGFTIEDIIYNAAEDERALALNDGYEPDDIDQSLEEAVAKKKKQMRLTPEEMNYLLSKWGMGYNVDQLLKLEKMYIEMMADYDIRTTNHKDNLKKLCTLSLRIDECIACSDFSGGKAANDMYDKLSKAANLQPVQNKTADENYLDAAGVLVKMCEQRGFIPKYVVDDSVPRDIVDLTIRDTQLYLKRLVDGDGTIMQRFEQEAEAYFAAQETDKEDTDEAFALLHDYDTLLEEEKEFSKLYD